MGTGHLVLMRELEESFLPTRDTPVLFLSAHLSHAPPLPLLVTWARLPARLAAIKLAAFCVRLSSASSAKSCGAPTAQHREIPTARDCCCPLSESAHEYHCRA